MTLNKTIKINIKDPTFINYEDMYILQGDLKDLSKENYDKLRKVIIEDGISENQVVWPNPKNKKYAILNGSQRFRVYGNLIKEGYNLSKVPVTKVQAKDEQEAVKICLTLASQYGDVNDDGLYALADRYKIDFAFLEGKTRYVEIDLEKFKSEYFDLPQEGLTDEDQVPEVGESITKLGDIWQLGNHRLMCGDSTDVGMVEKLMDGRKADLWLTDPPYGVSMQAREESSSSWVNKDRHHSAISNDDLSLEEMQVFWTKCATSAASVSSDTSCYYWFACQGGDQMMMMMSLGDGGWQVKHELIWVKDQMVFGRADYHYKHEPILYGWKRGGTHEWYGDRKQVSVIECKRPRKSDLHPTMKPIELLEPLLQNSTKSGQNVLDLFGGSGSTLIACQKTNRKCYSMEIDPYYVTVIIRRWEEFTGQKAVKL